MFGEHPEHVGGEEQSGQGRAAKESRQHQRTSGCPPCPEAAEEVQRENADQENHGSGDDVAAHRCEGEQVLGQRRHGVGSSRFLTRPNIRGAPCLRPMENGILLPPARGAVPEHSNEQRNEMSWLSICPVRAYCHGVQQKL